MKKLLSITAATALLVTANAEIIDLKPLDVLSTPLQNNELDTPAAVEIYTQQDIEEAQTENVYDFLTEQTSVMGMTYNGNTMTQLLDMRGYGIGSGFENIVVSIDGHRMNNIDGLPQFLGTIPSGAIERIEIFKSTGIVLHGDGANGGVINIVTKKKDGKSFTFYAGSHHTFNGSFYAGDVCDKYSVIAKGGAYQTGSTRHINSDGTKDEKRRNNGSLDVSYMATDELELRVGASFANADMWYGGPMTLDEYNENPAQQGTTVKYAPSIFASTGTRQKYSSNIVNAGLTYDLSKDWSIDADAKHEKKTNEYVSYSSVYHYVYDSAKLKLTYEADGLKVISGADLFDGSRQSYWSGGIHVTKQNGALYSLAQYKNGLDTYKAGYRYENVTYKSNVDEDKSDDLHGVELGYSHGISKQASLFVDYSHSYQSANIDRLFSAVSNTYTGYLEPMQAHNYNVGYRFVSPEWKLKTALYYVDLKNEFFYYESSNKNTNIEKSHKYGAEIVTAYKVDDAWKVGLNYSYVRAIVDEEVFGGTSYANKDLPGVPKHNIKANLTYKPSKKTTWLLSQVYRSKSYAAEDIGNSFDQKQEAYKSTNLAWTYKTKKYEYFAKINNLFNQRNGLWIQDDAIYPVNFTTTVIAGFKLKF